MADFQLMHSSNAMARMIENTFGLRCGIFAESKIVWIGGQKLMPNALADDLFSDREHLNLFARTLAESPKTTVLCDSAGRRCFIAPAVPMANHWTSALICAGFCRPDDDNPYNLPVIDAHDECIIENIVSAMAESIRTEPPHQIIQSQNMPDFAGISPAIQKIMNDLASAQSAPVLITGEQGTGKKLASRALHRMSCRARGPFVIMQCTDLSAAELESELFGCRCGSSPDAFCDKIGLIDAADGGTLLIDEISELPIKLQIRLHNFIESGILTAAGDAASHSANVRILASSSQDIEALANSGQFRRDLCDDFIIKIHMPTLAERREDIPLLAELFIAKRCAQIRRPAAFLEPQALSLLQQYAWPGNVRELQSEIERLVILSAADGGTISEQLISQRIINACSAADSDTAPPQENSESLYPMRPGVSLPDALEDIERNIIAAALAKNDGNRTRTAEVLGISRRNLIRKIESLNIHE